MTVLSTAPASTPESRTAEWLAETAKTDLLRFTTAGSVDDGKSTLIGRLLYDSKGVYEDQLASVRKATRNLSTGGLDLSLLTDGLRAEREQGITIDVAYRYFSTPRRKFIIADTPGHEQYTRNMATGASTANLAIVLIDARYGVLPQSRRHAYIAALLGIPHIVVAVNKMDLVNFREEVFTEIRRDFQAFAAQLHVGDLQFIPISALEGDNVVRRSTRTPWYTGPALLEHLETVPIASDRNLTDMRFPVQYVIRPNLDFRGFAGVVASGVIRRGDPILVLPSGRASRVRSIVTWDGELEEAFSPMSVTVCLEDEVDISRGDMLVHPDNAPHAGRRLEATLVWMNARPLEPNRPYLLKHSTQTAQAVVSVETQRPLFFDPYRQNRATGGFILIDPISNETIGAGMIEQAVSAAAPKGRVTASERAAARGHSAFAVCLPPGQQELAYALERLLFDHGCVVQVVERSENLRQAVRTCYAGGAIAILAPSTPEERQTVQEALPPDRVVLIEPETRETSTADTARHIWVRLEASGRLGVSQGPLTGGAGI